MFAPPIKSAQSQDAAGHRGRGVMGAGKPREALTRPAAVQSPIEESDTREPGKPLDVSTRAFMEPRFSRNFSDVRVHTDESAAQSARSLNATAYTVGKDIVFDTGQYAPASREGRRLIAHELTHVAQQDSGSGNKPWGSAALSVDYSDRLEQEAESVAAGVLAGRQMTVNSAPGSAMSVQRQPNTPAPTPPAWLGSWGSRATHVTGNIWDVQLPSLGSSWVGPYNELAAFIARSGFAGRLEAAHIVGGEHLRDIQSPLSYGDAPCIAVDASLHATWTAQTSGLQSVGGPAGMGGRATKRFERAQVGKRDVAGLYKELYSGHPELQEMARNIIRGSQIPPSSGAAPRPASPREATPGTDSSRRTSAIDAHAGTDISKRTSAIDAHQAPEIGTKPSSLIDAHQQAKILKSSSPIDIHKGPGIGVKSSAQPEGRPGAPKTGGPIGAFNTLMNIVWVIDLLRVVFGAGTAQQKAVAVGTSVVVGTLSGAALESLVGSELAGPIGFALSLRSDNAQMNREQEVNELIDDQTHELLEKIGNWGDSHPGKENPWHVHSREEARQYVIDKLVREQQEKLDEEKRKAQEKLEEQEAKRQDALHDFDTPAAAAVLGDAIPL